MIAFSGVLAAELSAAPPLDELRRLLRVGEYDAVLRGTQEGIDHRQFGEEWYLLKNRSGAGARDEMRRPGKRCRPGCSATTGASACGWIGITAARFRRRCRRATILMTEIQDLAGRGVALYRYRENLVALGAGSRCWRGPTPAMCWKRFSIACCSSSRRIAKRCSPA